MGRSRMASGFVPTASAVTLSALSAGEKMVRLRCFSAMHQVVTTVVTCIVADLRYWRCQRKTGFVLLAKAERALLLTCLLQLLQALQAGRSLVANHPQSRRVVDLQLLVIGT